MLDFDLRNLNELLNGIQSIPTLPDSQNENSGKILLKRKNTKDIKKIVKGPKSKKLKKDEEFSNDQSNEMMKGKKGNKNKKNKKEEETYISSEQLNNPIEHNLNFSIIFTKIFRNYLRNLFHPDWEIRHAACLVLRAFFKENCRFLDFEANIKMQHQSKLGVINQLKEELNSYLMTEELSFQKRKMDMTLKILVLVALDRFGDFLFEKVIEKKDIF